MSNTQKYETRDGARRIRFEGIELASSSSEYPGKPRWIEFTLYKTKGGQYVLYRVGRSYVYHTRDCPIVIKNRLSMYPEEHLPSRYTPCQDCKPSIIETEGLYPETPRYYTQSSDTPEGILALLHKTDSSGVKYLTNVAKELLTTASQLDSDVKTSFNQGTLD